MPKEWLDITIGEQLAAWAAVLSVLAAMAYLGRVIVKYIHPMLRKFQVLYDKIMGRLPDPQLGDAGEPGIFVQLDTVREQIADVREFEERRLSEQDVKIEEIKTQVTPNHGSTDRLADLVSELNKKIGAAEKEN